MLRDHYSDGLNCHLAKSEQLLSCAVNLDSLISDFVWIMSKRQHQYVRHQELCAILICTLFNSLGSNREISHSRKLKLCAATIPRDISFNRNLTGTLDCSRTETTSTLP